jgi:hypothetical protein
LYLLAVERTARSIVRIATETSFSHGESSKVNDVQLPRRLPAMGPFGIIINPSTTEEFVCETIEDEEKWN